MWTTLILSLFLFRVYTADSVSSDEEFAFSDEDEEVGVATDHYETLVS